MGQLRRPRLLFLCQTTPYPPDGGVWIRTFHVLRTLASEFDVTALCFERSGRSGAAPAAVASAGKALRQFGRTELFDLPQRHSPVRFVWDHLRSLVRGRVYTEFLYDSRHFRRRLRKHLADGRFDLVHADSLDLAAYLPECGDLPVVVVHHDIESLLLQRRAEVEPNRWRRKYLHYQSSLMAGVERQWCPDVALNVVTSDRDRRDLRRRMPGIRVMTVPNGVTIDVPAGEAAQDNNVAFIGGTTPFPNLDALSMFAEQVLPHLRGMVPGVRVTWIGRASPDQQEHYRSRYGIQLTGYVEDVMPLVRAARCHIVPLRVGGGTRLKILTAWAAAKPVISTSIGCEGLAVNDGVNILVRDNPVAFAVAVENVLNDEPLRRRLGEQGRATVERSYSWDAIGEKMLGAYLSLAHARYQGEIDVRSRRCAVSMAGRVTASGYAG